MKGAEASSATVARRRVWINSKASAAAVERLEEAATSADAPKVREHERIIGTAPNADAFFRWSAANTQLKCEYVNGNIRVRELPYNPHAEATVMVASIFLGQRGNELRVGTDQDIMDDRANPDGYRPDVLVKVRGQSLFPAPQVDLAGYGVIIVEIATSQRPKDLHKKAKIYLGNDFPRTEIFVGLKRFPERVDGSIALLATVYFRPARVPGAAPGGGPAVGLVPARAISFGDCPISHRAKCPWQGGHTIITGVGHGGPALNGPGIPLYVIQFPAASLFTTFVPPAGGQAGVPPAGAPVNYTLDLFPVREMLMQPFVPSN